MVVIDGSIESLRLTPLIRIVGRHRAANNVVEVVALLASYRICVEVRRRQQDRSKSYHVD